LSTDDHVDLGFGARRRERGDLAGAEKGRWVGLGPFLKHAEDDFGAGRFGEPRELVERPLGIEPLGTARNQPDERCPLAAGAPAAAGPGVPIYPSRRHDTTVSHGITPRRTRRGSPVDTSTIVEGRPPSVFPASSTMSTRGPSEATTSSGSPVA
jgi:hypothetical protein